MKDRNEDRNHSRITVHTLGKAGIAAMLVACSIAASAAPHASADGGADRAQRSTERSGARRRADDLSNAFRGAARTIAPSVVTINTTSSRQRIPASVHRGLPALPPGFEMPTPVPPQRVPNSPARGTGTGVVISRDGYVVTANHVVADADEIELVFSDGRSAKATIVGLDPGTDIAVLRTSESGLEPAAFGDSDALETGEWVVAIGAPFGLEQTVTAGIVSAKGRSDVGLATFENYIQTDAAINPGNSGGPLANLDGEIVGINSAISSRGGGNDGIGFAVPSAVVKRVVDSIIANGRVARGFLGVGVQPADGEMLAGLGVQSDTGVLVNRVERDSPAAKAGIETGDVITSIDGRKVRTPGELVAAIGSAEPGRVVDLRAVRDGVEQRMQATLAERQDDGASRAAGGSSSEQSSADAQLGMKLRAIGADDAASLGIELASASALVVESVDPTGPAAAAGIEAGDVIRRIGSREVATLKDARAALGAARADAPIAVLVEREGRTRFVLVRPVTEATEPRARR
jgi:serine protease Do